MTHKALFFSQDKEDTRPRLVAAKVAKRVSDELSATFVARTTEGNESEIEAGARAVRGFRILSVQLNLVLPVPLACSFFEKQMRQHLRWMSS